MSSSTCAAGCIALSPSDINSLGVERRQSSGSCRLGRGQSSTVESHAGSQTSDGVSRHATRKFILPAAAAAAAVRRRRQHGICHAVEWLNFIHHSSQIHPSATKTQRRRKIAAACHRTTDWRATGIIGIIVFTELPALNVNTSHGFLLSACFYLFVFVKRAVRAAVVLSVRPSVCLSVTLRLHPRTLCFQVLTRRMAG